MNVKRLWAPWRVHYITAIGKKTKGCVFCSIRRQKKDRKNLIFIRRRLAYGVLNIYPYNNGHCLIIPNRHVNDLRKLSAAEKAELYGLVEETQDLLDRTIHPEGYNIGINCGRVAGAGFPGHIHIHIVPRWRGDVNFMPVTGQTKVISQSLEALYDLLIKDVRAQKTYEKKN